MAAERSGEDDRDNLRAEVLTPAEGETQFATHTVGPGETIGGAPAGEASAGAVIGFYRLEQPIGRGGMGEVWLAEQEQPVRRRVAIKLIKAGMDTREVVARFEAERQTLALMDHPAIAKVFDAGSTPQGRPYMAMEHGLASETRRGMDKDDDLKPLRGDPRFDAILASARQIAAAQKTN